MNTGLKRSFDSAEPEAAVENLQGSSRTLTEQAYELLRRDILTGALPPEMKLQAETLKVRYGVGGSTLREALTRLTAESLVTFEGQRGFRVAATSREDFADLCDVRKIIEVEALKRSIMAGDDEWEGNVVASFHRLAKIDVQLPDHLNGLYDEWEERNRIFHRTLISACPSRWLLRMHDQLFQQAERYRRITFATRTSTPRNVHQEHRSIMEAAIARDVDAACGLAASHILRTVSVLEEAVVPRQNL
jgi:GntR family transcriptional regulator, carbon starvation induced regulator